MREKTLRMRDRASTEDLITPCVSLLERLALDQVITVMTRPIQKMHFGVIGPRSLGGMSQRPKKEVLLKKFFRILLIHTAPGGQRFSRFEVKLYTPYTNITSQLNAKNRHHFRINRGVHTNNIS